MAVEISSSTHWRKEGNSIYITAKDNLSPTVRRDRLRRASNCYYKALNLSANEEERISASKNLAMVSWQMAKTQETSLERINTLVHFYKEAFKHFSLCFRDGQDLKPQGWSNNILASARLCWEQLKTGAVSNQEMDVRIHVFHDVVSSIQIDEIKAECYVETTTCHFHAGITAIQTGDYRRGLSEMKDCYQPVSEAKQIGKTLKLTTVIGECHVLEEDILMHQCIAESIQARVIGDQLYNKLLLEEEELNMDLVWQVIDWYKQSVIRTREVTEVEQEAVALSRIGRVYDKVLKLKYKSKEYHMRCMQLAHSMHPRTFNQEEWYKDCAEALKRFQEQTVQHEQEKWAKEREEHLKNLTKELEALKKEDDKDNRLDLVKYVYRVFPPKNKDHKLEGVPKKKGSTLPMGETKKIFQKAIVHYHPDKVDIDKYGKQWKVMSEEITKVLTRRYECMKG